LGEVVLGQGKRFCQQVASPAGIERSGAFDANLAAGK
jgi:hypothetical protein